MAGGCAREGRALPKNQAGERQQCTAGPSAEVTPGEVRQKNSRPNGKAAVRRSKPPAESGNKTSAPNGKRPSAEVSPGAVRQRYFRLNGKAAVRRSKPPAQTA